MAAEPELSKITEEEVIEIVRRALGETRTHITTQSLMKDVPEWDSLTHLQILVDLDARFDGRIAEINEMASADSVKQIIDLLKKHSLIS